MARKSIPFAALKRLVAMDLYRYASGTGWKLFYHTWFWEPGFRYTTVVRLCNFLYHHQWLRWGAYHFVRLWYWRMSARMGMQLEFTTQVGGGLLLPHATGITIHPEAVIGENCNINQHATIGVKNRDPRKGCPTLGNRVFVGPGAVIVGGISIGDDAAIGANAVVLEDCPPKGVMVGIPGKVVSARGSEGYVNRCLPILSDV